MDYALRAYVHIGPGRHLAILADAEGVETLPVILLRVVGNHHSVRHNHSRGVLVAGEQPHGMAGIHHQGLFVRHRGQVLHGQQILGPVLEDGPVASVDYEFVGMLRHPGIQIVLYHSHYGGRLPALGRVFANGTGVHLIGRTETVHIDASVVLKFFRELTRQSGVELRGEVAQGIFHCQDLLLRA